MIGAFKDVGHAADSLCGAIVQFPSIDQLGVEVEALQQEAAILPEDYEAVLEHLAKLRTLAVYLNAHLVAQAIPEA